ANLRELLRTPFKEYPYLTSVLKELCELKQFSSEADKRALTVKVMSFAYKTGIPNDNSGNGGGFVFDCRAVNNPGKYERYKPFTGLDTNVIEFLETDGEITRFLEHCYELVDASVERYIERGFTNLMVCFGCTGGRHRSVYSAQHMAEHISKKFGVKVELVHREQQIEQTFPAKR
ncbi:MAG: phosphotransferase, partial [Muribaculaceae bacterium]|nr:phosphotransferase [Muribaculaceae bacterium]